MTTSETARDTDAPAEQVPLSFSQEFLCLFDKGDDEGPFGPRYNIVCGWRVSGAVDLGILQAALDDVVVRHEALRTAIVRGPHGGYQRVGPPLPAELTVRELPGVPADERERRAEELLIECEATEFSVRAPVLIRAVLGRFDERDAVLVLIAHHTAVDEWSMKLVARDIAASYSARCGNATPAPERVAQYREYAVWDRARGASDATERARRYWREKLRGAWIVPMHTDVPRSAKLPKNTAAHRFLIDAESTGAALALARSMRSSPFMVLLAAYQVFLHEICGATDMAVTTLASGRGDARFERTVGSFFNLLPLRTDLAGCASFRDVVARTRRTCLEAYAHELPFRLLLEEVPEVTSSFEGDGLALFSFQVFQFPFVMERERVGDLEYSDIRRRLLSQPVTTDVPDGGLWTLDLDPAGDIVGSLWYNTNLFHETTISNLTAGFRRVLRRVVEAPDASVRIA